MLIVMAGLPGSGKSTIAAAAGRALGCAVIAVDAVEAAMLRAGIGTEQPTGLAAYVVADAVAREQLRLGHDVCVDAVNDAPAARLQWRDLAAAERASLLFVEVLAPEPQEHRRRLESRERDLDGFPEPTWESVLARRSGFDEWTDDRLRLDAGRPVEENVRLIASAVALRRDGSSD
ncbi:AAA family ATPase [Microbacterium gorillae]|uniref:AAA family ATPase n=1 Tax=Microbacterium gorillae TaxID=1231063 RepID=UPI00058EA021|nr:AAA family ATPase [Microbacterium gorillae]